LRRFDTSDGTIQEALAVVATDSLDFIRSSSDELRDLDGVSTIRGAALLHIHSSHRTGSIMVERFGCIRNAPVRCAVVVSTLGNAIGGILRYVNGGAVSRRPVIHGITVGCSHETDNGGIVFGKVHNLVQETGTAAVSGRDLDAETTRSIEYFDIGTGLGHGNGGLARSVVQVELQSVHEELNNTPVNVVGSRRPYNIDLHNRACIGILDHNSLGNGQVARTGYGQMLKPGLDLARSDLRLDKDELSNALAVVGKTIKGVTVVIKGRKQR
jgi:hypothetical protein